MSPEESKITVFHSISQLYTLSGPTLRKGSELGRIEPHANGYVVVEAGKVKEVGSGEGYRKFRDAELISLQGMMVFPGFIDAHTHLVHAGTREKEMRRKLNGESYLEILKNGGGILSTVRQTRQASFQELYALAGEHLKRMLSFGVTSAEAKSGYGLDCDTELRQLEVIQALNRNLPLTLVPTFMGMHALPDEFKSDRQSYLDLMKNVLNEVKERGLAEFVDVFCEEGVFSLSESREFLEYAQSLGFKLKIHADEMSALGGTQLAAELNAVSAEHLLAASDDDLQALAKSDTVAVMLPLTSFYLNKEFAQARKIIDYGGAVALGSDYNPGSSPSENLQLAMQLAVLKMKMTPDEVLTAVTVNAAYACGLSEKGSLTPGKDADFVVLEANNLDYFFYRFGINLVKEVYIKGKRVY